MTEWTGHKADTAAAPPVEAGTEGNAGLESLQRLTCRTVATTRLRQRHHIRDLQPFGSGTQDPADGGSLLSDDEEPHPSEMLLAALGACLTVGIQANAVARGIPLRTLEVHTKGDIEASAFWATGPRQVGPLGFQSITVDVLIEADVPHDALKTLVDFAVLRSPVANTLHDPVDLLVNLRSS